GVDRGLEPEIGEHPVHENEDRVPHHHRGSRGRDEEQLGAQYLGRVTDLLRDGDAQQGTLRRGAADQEIRIRRQRRRRVEERVEVRAGVQGIGWVRVLAGGYGAVVLEKDRVRT